MLSTRTSLIGLCLSLNGCATTAGSADYGSLRSDYEHAAPVRAAPSRPAATGSGVASDDDARALAGSVLGRAAFVRAVLSSNPSIEAARQGWHAALSRVRQVAPFDDPTVDVGVAPLSVGSSRAPFGYEVGVSQRLPWFGKRSLEASIAAAEAEAAKSDFESVRRDLALTALTLYDQYFVAVRSLEINAQHVELLRTFRASATAQFEAGRASAQDPLQAEVELAHRERDAAVLASDRDVVAGEMNELLHRVPEEPLPPPPNELPLSPAPDIADMNRLQADAVSARPEITAARERALAERTRVARARREDYPDFTVSTSYNSMWSMPEHRWMLGLAFDLPIQTGRRTGAVEEATALRGRFESDVARLEDAARTQVFVTLKRVRESRQVLDLFERRLLPVARDQVDAARAGFVSSRNSFAVLIDAERNLRTTELDYQMARADCDRRHAELDRALGRVPGVDGRENDR